MPNRRPHILADLVKIAEGHIAAIDLTTISAAWPEDVRPLLARAMAEAKAAQDSILEAQRRLASELTDKA